MYLMANFLHYVYGVFVFVCLFLQMTFMKDVN